MFLPRNIIKRFQCSLNFQKKSFDKTQCSFVELIILFPWSRMNKNLYYNLKSQNGEIVVWWGQFFLKTQSAESRTIHVREPEPAIIPSEEPLLGTRGQLVIESFPAIN